MDEPSEPAASTSQAIGNGTKDTTNKYPFVAALVPCPNGVCTGTPPPPQQAVCSAVLLTPVWLASASHCFLPSGNTPAPINPAGSFWAIFAQDLTSFDVVNAVPHTPASGNVLLAQSSLPASGTAFPRRDIALIKLDSRVTAAFATPVHPPGILGVPDVCRPHGILGLTGTAVGYG